MNGRRRRRRAALVSAALSLGGCADEGSPDAVFLIVVDTLRSDRLSCYGSEVHRTQAIDQLAASGVLFTNAHSAASWTVPSIGSILTSRYPTQLGLIEVPLEEEGELAKRWKRPQRRYTLPLSVQTLPEILSEAGFHTAAFVNQPFINARDGFLQGFDEWCHTVSEDELKWQDPRKPFPRIHYPPNTDLGYADELLVAAFGDWLKDNASTRPFVWLHLLKPHWPYLPDPRQTGGQAGDRDGRLPFFYDAEVREVDTMIAAVTAAIDEHVGLERSLIVFLSDHGEEFGEHGMWEHGHSLHREVLQVPLIIASPSLPSGETVDAHVSTIDVLPSILELVGVEPVGLEGTSLTRLIGNESPGDGDVFSEGMLYGATERSLISSGYKLMYDGSRSPPYRVFALGTDPLERTDLSGSLPDEVARLRTTMAKLHERTARDLAGDADGEDTPELDESLRSSMRALGYVD